MEIGLSTCSFKIQILTGDLQTIQCVEEQHFTFRKWNAIYVKVSIVVNEEPHVIEINDFVEIKVLVAAGFTQ